MTDVISGALRVWFRQELQAFFSAAVTPPIGTIDIADQFNTLNSKAGMLMATLSDIQATLASNEAAEQKLMMLVSQQAAMIVSLGTQLSQAVASNDPAAITAIVNQMQADAAAMEAAVAAASAPTPPPVEPPPMPIPPGSPVIT
jgi:hypothetical protein